MPRHKIKLNVDKATPLIPQRVTVRQGESGTQTIEAAVLCDGAPYTPDLESARLDIMHADGTWARVAATVSDGAVSCTLPSAALASSGMCKLAHFVFFTGAERAETTEGFELLILPAVDTSDEQQEAQDYDDLLTKLWKKWSALEAEASKAEAARVKAEDDRASAEAKRKEAEKARASAESARASAEAKRVDAETGRSGAETARAASEKQRESAENARIEAENARKRAETQREGSENERELAQQKNNADQALNNEAMKKLAPVILQEGQFDPDTLAPTIEGEANRMYLVPMSKAVAATLGISERAVESGNSYAEWMWIGGKWELVGESTIRHKSISTDQIDSVFADESPTGDETLNLTGLSYVWAKISAWAKGAFAAITHKHGAGDITSGTLPIARGGTGGATAEAARAALGASSQADTDALRESLSHVVLKKTITVTTTPNGNAGVELSSDTYFLISVMCREGAPGLKGVGVVCMPYVYSIGNRILGFHAIAERSPFGPIASQELTVDVYYTKR